MKATLTLISDQEASMKDLPAGWREWISPNKVSHVVPPNGACATCGQSRHVEPEAEFVDEAAWMSAPRT